MFLINRALVVFFRDLSDYRMYAQSVEQWTQMKQSTVGDSITDLIGRDVVLSSIMCSH